MSEEYLEESSTNKNKSYFTKISWWIKTLYFLTLALLIILLVVGKCNQYGQDALGKTICVNSSFQLWLILPIIALLFLLIWFTQTLRDAPKLTHPDCVKIFNQYIRFEKNVSHTIDENANVILKIGTRPQWMDEDIETKLHMRWYNVTIENPEDNTSEKWIFYINVNDSEDYGFEPDKGQKRHDVIKKFNAETEEQIEAKRLYNEKMRSQRSAQEEGDR